MLFHSAWMRALNIWLLPIMLLVFSSLFAEGTPRQLPIAIVDADNSHQSRSLQRHLDASPGLQAIAQFSSVHEGSAALRQGKVLALVVVPHEFEQHLRLGLSPEVVVFYNSQYLLAGKLAATAVREASALYSAKAGVMLRVAYGQDALSAVAAAGAVQPQITPLFNPAMNYAHFLGTAIVPALWQLFVVMSTLLALAWRFRQGQLPLTFSARCRVLAQTLAPVSVAMLLQGWLMLWLFHYVMGWQVAGSKLWLLLGVLLMLLATQAMALLIMALSKNLVRSLSVSAAYLAPAFAFMGVTFPRADMSLLARFWGNIMPSTHYLKLQVAVADQGATLAIIWPSLLALLAFLCVLPVALWRYPSTLPQEPNK